jgi:hypothetical protein
MTSARSAADRREQVQPIEPSYLLNAVTNRPGVGMAVTGDASTTVVEMAAHGQWSQHLGNQVAAGLPLCLAGPWRLDIVGGVMCPDGHRMSRRPETAYATPMATFPLAWPCSREAIAAGISANG